MTPHSYLSPKLGATVPGTGATDILFQHGRHCHQGLPDAETQHKLVAELQGHVAMLARHKVGRE
jgi:hypothetical protein